MNSVRVKEVYRLRHQLDETIRRLSTHSDRSDDPEIQSDVARYLCVLISGYFERSVVDMIISYTRKNASSEITSYVDHGLKRWANPNLERVTQLFCTVNKEWKESIKNKLSGEYATSINSVASLRNNIAHGESVSLGLVQIKEHYQRIVTVIDYLAQITKYDMDGEV